MFEDFFTGVGLYRIDVTTATEAAMRMGFLGVIVLVWLLIGVVAAYQRNYFETNETNCATAGTIALTVVSGPLNYFGVNPKVEDCQLPQPSQ